jgi:alpha-L-rhamnosidase
MPRRSLYILIFWGLVIRVAAQLPAPAPAREPAPAPAALASPVVEVLQCEQLSDPSGIDARIPRLSWQLTGSQPNLRQTAYQVLVASSKENLVNDKGDLWNSGKVAGGKSRMIDYAGVPLKSRTGCYWKVKVWTTAGETAWSQPANWSMGLLDPSDWKARWIGYDQGFPWDSVSKFSRLSARYFRREFRPAAGIRSATLYIAGLGHYELYMNGHSVGHQVLAEAPTDYTRSIRYNTFDITKDCQKGVNAIGVVLGNGRFFTMRPKYKPKKIKEFGFPKLLLQLEIVYDNGARQQIVSNDNWKFTADGPIRTNNEYDGEEYDATKELTGWDQPGYNDSHWLKPSIVGSPGGRLEAQMNEPIKVKAIVRPVSVSQSKSGAWIMDMGQNMAGWVQMKVKGKRGDQVTLRYGETLQKNGSLYTANLRDAKVTDIYTLEGEGQEVWHPVFVFHGFRYVEISNYPGQPSIDDFEGQVVYDDMATIGSFQTSDTLINRIDGNAWWGIQSNYKGLPLDCPQRNERMPWLGDRAVGSLGESFMFDNENLYAKWLDDIEESQKPDGSLPDVAPAYWNYYSDNMTWPGAYILIADMLYNQFGNRRPIERHYASMKKWLLYMGSKYGKAGLMPKDKYGDWCVPPESPELIHSKDSSRITDGQLIATASWYHLLTLMQRFAGLLKQPTDAAVYSATALKVKNAFNRRYLDPASGQYANNTVTSNLLPLSFGMVPEPDRVRVFAHIVDKIEKDNNGHLSTGVIGTQWLMRGLTEYGRPDLAFRIADNKDYPGWGYMVQHGATTIWELWNGDSANPAMNSHNHIMLLGDLITWFYEDLAGIAPAEPGFSKIRMKPVFPPGLNDVKASYRTPYGLVKSEWHRKEGGLSWDISVPPNTQALVHLPSGEDSEVGAGDYHFTITNKKRI